MSIHQHLFQFRAAVQCDRVHTSFYSLFMTILTNEVILHTNNLIVKERAFLFFYSQRFCPQVRDPDLTAWLHRWPSCWWQQPARSEEVGLAQRALVLQVCRTPRVWALSERDNKHRKGWDWQARGSLNLSASCRVSEALSQVAAQGLVKAGLRAGSSFFCLLFTSEMQWGQWSFQMAVHIYVYLYVHTLWQCCVGIRMEFPCICASHES